MSISGYLKPELLYSVAQQDARRGLSSVIDIQNSIGGRIPDTISADVLMANGTVRECVW